MAARSAAEGNKDTPTRTANREDAEQATQPRHSGQDAGHSRSVENVPSDQTVPEQVYADYAQNYGEDDAALNGRIPDVLLDAPVVSIKGLDFELDDLRAKVSLFAKVLDLVELSVGIDAYLGKVKLAIESVDVQALLKVRLDNVTAILDRVLTTIDRNPQIVQELASGVGSAVEDVGEGAGELVGEGANEAVSEIGSGTGSAVEDVGEGAGEAVEDVGEGAGSAVGDVGHGAGQAVEDVGGGAGQAAGELGQGAVQAAQEVGRGAGQAAKQVGDSVGQTAQGATDAAGEAAGQAGDATEQAPEGAQEGSGRTAEGTAASGAQVLSETTDEAGRPVRRVADESGSIVEQTLTESGQVSEEAVVGEASTNGEAGEENGEVQATPAAKRKAEDLGVDLSQVEGTGSGGRITVKDVIGAANQG
jgi:e3 binding domain